MSIGFLQLLAVVGQLNVYGLCVAKVCIRNLVAAYSSCFVVLTSRIGYILDIVSKVSQVWSCPIKRTMISLGCYTGSIARDVPSHRKS
jgi:hypothetical protein